MQRKAIQILLFSTYRRTSKISRTVPCSCFHVATTRYKSQPQWIPVPTSEVKKDFSDQNPDQFGSLSQTDIHDEMEELSDEVDDREEFDVVNEEGRKQRRPMVVYHKIIKKLLEEKKVADAIDTLETRMLKKDKVKPDIYTYNLLINGCARVGYCQKAFKLYHKMKERQITRTPATFTGLFNACAMSPFPEDALIRLNNLRKHLMENSWELNQINYLALMKAYARLKDVQSAFSVADEMLSKNFTVTNEVLSFLLQAAISDKECGLRHALLAWHKMRKKKITPDLWNYNLLIRCIRDCGVGDEEELQNLIIKITDGEKCNHLQITDQEKSSNYQEVVEADGRLIDEMKVNVEKISTKPEFTFEELESVENRPNLLAKKPHLGTILSVRQIKTPTDRLLLLGGFKTLLKEMEEDNVKPDIKTFTQLLNIMPSTTDSEEYLMDEMKKYKVGMDIDFCNMLIKQRALRMDYEKAREVLSIIQANYLHPDIITFGVLALSCRKKWEAQELMNTMQDFSYRLNIEILGTMLNQACHQYNFDYVMYIMRLTKKLRIQPNEMYMKDLEELQRKAVEFRRRLKNKDKSVPSIVNQSWFREYSLRFSDYYAQWRKEVTVFKPPHPYKQFRKSNSETQNINTSKRDDEDTDRTEYDENRREKSPEYSQKKFRNRMKKEFDYSERENAVDNLEVKQLSWKNNTKAKQLPEKNNTTAKQFSWKNRSIRKQSSRKENNSNKENNLEDFKSLSQNEKIAGNDSNDYLAGNQIENEDDEKCHKVLEYEKYSEKVAVANNENKNSRKFQEETEVANTQSGDFRTAEKQDNSSAESPPV